MSGVGKTSIITRFLNGSYRETYVATTEDTYKWVEHRPEASDRS